MALRHFAAIFLLLFLAATKSFALPSFKSADKNKQELPAVLKADEVDGDRVTNTLIASGNVEVSKGNSILYSDKATYNKDNKTIRAIGHVRVKNIEVGFLNAKEAEMKDDFSKGKFIDSQMVFNDGSYLSSPEINRQTPLVTVLDHPIYSICPNDEIAADTLLAGKKRDFASITSSKTTIDREKGVMKSKHGVMRLYNIPILYTPYLSVPLPSKEKESGFLSPSYMKSTNLGLGINLPYYFNIAPNMDLTTTPFFGISTGQILISNQLRHKTTYGEYLLKFEGANNKINSSTDTTVISRTNKAYRWDLSGSGVFDFTENTGMDFLINTIGDRDYLRDYHFSYLAYTLSKVNIDYIKGRTYYAAKTLRFQELEDRENSDSAQLVLPSLDAHIETKPMSFKEKFALTSNVTNIMRDSGLQYRRATAIPAVNVPFNLRGNLFTVDARVQTDFYSMENNFKHSAPTNNYDSTAFNYKPEFSINWRLPLIKKFEKTTLLIEPMANLVASTFQGNFNRLPNEDSNNSELTASNLFISDRIYGFDRNEAGERFNYGVKSSLFNTLGQFGLFVGQGYRKDVKNQDVTIRGFADNNKSNIVGQAMYKSKKYFSILYSFQLNESSYSNEVNQVTTTLTFDRFSISNDFLFLRKTPQNPDERKQSALSANIKLGTKWRMTIGMSKDFVTQRTISRGVSFYRDGCCTVFGFSAIENDQSNLIKPQRTFNLSFSFKNL